MPNVSRGGRMGGLLRYLVGPGRANEHTEPHLVAGDPAVLAWHDDDELGRDAVLGIGRHLDQPRVVYGVAVAGGHVWHCSLSLRAEEGVLSDAAWAGIARDFVTAMGFDDNAGSKAPCRWVGIRHGVSAKGNDHVHIAVNLVREDGTKAGTHHDFRRAQAAARALETPYGLELLESVTAARATRGYDPAEREAQARARARYERARPTLGAAAPGWEQLGREERLARVAAEVWSVQPRSVLALKVRAASTASASEAEFVRRMRGTGLLVRPRYADGRTDVVTGYSVAGRPEAGERPIWYGGGHLGRDLSLPRLRDGWPDTPTGASAAVAEWTAAKRGRRVVTAGREAREPEPGLWEQRNADLAVLVDRLRTVSVDDRDTWATVARQTAGALAAWSTATEQTPGDLAAAADALSRSAQTYEQTVRPEQAGTAAISGAAMLLASAARGGRGTVGQAVMIRQLLRLTQAVYDAAVAGAQARQARCLAEDTRARLVRVRDAMPKPIDVRQPRDPGQTITAERPARLDPEAQAMLDWIRAGQAKPATAATSPVPNPLEPDRARQTTTPGTDRGLER